MSRRRKVTASPDPRRKRRSRPSGSGGPSAYTRRNGPILVAAMVAAAVLTRMAFHGPAGRVPALAFAIAGVLLAGTYLSGGMPRPHKTGRHPVVGPVLTAAALFAAFALLDGLSRLVPPVHHATQTVLARADLTTALVLGTIAASVAEELFYRGALFERVRLPILTTTVAHMLTTLPAANVALTATAGLLGLVLGITRRTSGGWWAPAVTHVAWAFMVLAWLPR